MLRLSIVFSSVTLVLLSCLVLFSSIKDYKEQNECVKEQIKQGATRKQAGELCY